ncbi:MAG: dTMP kinase [Hyphomicrobiaceae bacterium]
MANGKFITLEGGEGAGKSTQARRLAQRLMDEDIAALVTREPGGSPLGERIRGLILEAPEMRPETELFLFAAQRAEHLAATIVPALARGSWVISDRFVDSTRVYQGDLGQLDAARIAEVERLSVARLPDLTLILDLPIAVGHARATLRGAQNRYDAQSEARHEIVRQGFLRIARAEPDRCAVVDASNDADTVAEAIWAIVRERLGP